MSEIKVNKLSPRTNCGTVQLGDSGDTITIPAGVTITNNGTAAGFGSTGEVSWDTTVKTTGFTAVSGVGYFVNTTAGIITVTLPASPSAGDVVAVSDYAGTADTNAITIGRNSSNINGAAADLTISNENSAITLVYVDGTQGWKATNTSNLNDIELQPTYITATGGTITESGDYKIHTFTGTSAFCVSSVGNPAGSDEVSYLVVAGGGGGGNKRAGGGGAGGFREGKSPQDSYTASPIACTSGSNNGLPVTVQSYPIIVGSGGLGGIASGPACSVGTASANGLVSTFSTITSAGGGTGGGVSPNAGPNGSGGPGGSGGGGFAGGVPSAPFPASTVGGVGNTPPVSPAQGFDGGVSRASPCCSGQAGGGGGAAALGKNGNDPGGNDGNGGAGASTEITGSAVTRGGGGGSGSRSSGGVATSGGAGGGGAGSPTGNGTNGTANTGGGGGGMSDTACSSSGNGGSGIVVIRYKFQN
jgi:hypothetical protein